MSSHFRSYQCISNPVRLLLSKSRSPRINSMLTSRYELSSVSTTPILMPSLSPTMTQGTISSWKAKPGDRLKPGDVLCEIETDKATLAFEVQDENVLAKILVEASSEVPVGKPIAISVDDEAAYQEFLKSGGVVDIPTTTAAPSAAPAAAPAATTSAPSKSTEKKLSPAARYIATNYNIDVSGIKGSGKHGMIVKGDLTGLVKPRPVTVANNVVASSSATAAPVSSAPATKPTPVSISNSPVNDRYVDIPNSNMRKVIAKRLSESKTTVPHFYTTIECNVDSVMKLRKVLKRDYNANISVNDFVIKAAALALRDVPGANAKWDPKTNSVVAQEDIDISVAVATPNGLITPIVTNSHKRGLVDINLKVKDLATRAKDNKLKPEEFQGGSFSISNLGMFGVSFFSAVINPPQACILAVGSGVPRVVPPLNPSDKEPRITTTVQVQLSADRRVIDEATAAQFLQVFQKYMNDANALVM